MYKLLIVDDEYEIRNGLSNYYPWQEVGFECVACAQDGVNALDILKTTRVDVVLSDIVMPKMGGIELAENIRRIAPECRVVFLSGYKDFEYARQAISNGVRFYILKPTRYSEITEIFTQIRQELDAVAPAPESAALKGSAGALRAVNAVREYVLANYRDASLGGASHLVHMHPFYVSRIFKENTGKSFTDFVIEARMSNAARLLCEQELKVFQVSEMVGYSSAKNFTRVFKAYYGVSPREYKNARYMAGKS